MSAAEFQQWWLHYQLEPWGEARGDLRMAILASTMAQLWSTPGPRRITPADFLPDFWPTTLARTPTRAGRQSSQDIGAVLLWGTRATGGTIDPRVRQGMAPQEAN
jgi:hypothetical protein